jgi:conjugative relaxase-like TrwC/TraI family protein
MMTPFAIRSADHAADYYEQSDHADYYAKDDSCPSSWEGKGAELLGIKGQIVEKDRFKRYLEGDIAGQQLGTMRAGKLTHKPAFDLTFSPSKSVSVVALVGGDERVLAAHEEAVKEALAYVEDNATFKRKHTIDTLGRSQIEQVKTERVVAAVFRHETSRADANNRISPQLHSHAVVINATCDEDGNWRSIESRHIWCLQKEIGLRYRQQLASKLVDLGYQIERRSDANFEVSGVPQKVCDAFSLRRDIIDAELEKRGYTRESAPSYLKEQIAHRVREKKIHVDRDDLKIQWEQTESELGFDSKKIVKQSIHRTTDSLHKERNLDQSFENLKRVTELSISSLSEREAVFSKDELVNQINQQAVGYGISAEQVNNHINQIESEERLIQRETEVYLSQFQERRIVAAYTTPELIELEKRLVESVCQGVNKHQSEFSEREIENTVNAANQQSIELGYEGWNLEQKTATRGLLSSNDQITALQGLAGTAKTSTVLRTLASASKDRGYEVIGMAPSASACESLRQGTGLDTARTVASHLLQTNFKNSESKKQIWLVDEASLLSSKDMLKLIKQAQKQEAKVFLVGDTKQLGSVDAGAAFRQLQEAGMQTHQLTEIVRQENEHALDAVYSTIDSDTKRALQFLTDGGGQVISDGESADKRYDHIIKNYISLSNEERDKTLIIDPSRESRQALTNVLREELKLSGDIAITGIESKRLEKVNLTKSAQSDVLNFTAGMVIKFGRQYKHQDIEKDSYWSVDKVDVKKNTITLKSEEGREVTWSPESIWGKRMQLYTELQSELCLGDKIIWTQNTKELKLTNGIAGEVVYLDENMQEATIEFANGKQLKINSDEMKHQHWNHNFVTTVHASQGMTADRVFYHAESYRKNLTSQKSFYVALSRAKQEVIVVTDSKAELIEQVKEHNGEKQNALDSNKKDQEVEYEY